MSRKAPGPPSLKEFEVSSGCFLAFVVAIALIERPQLLLWFVRLPLVDETDDTRGLNTALGRVRLQSSFAVRLHPETSLRGSRSCIRGVARPVRSALNILRSTVLCGVVRLNQPHVMVRW